MNIATNIVVGDVVQKALAISSFGLLGSKQCLSCGVMTVSSIQAREPRLHTRPSWQQSSQLDSPRHLVSDSNIIV